MAHGWGQSAIPVVSSCPSFGTVPWGGFPGCGLSRDFSQVRLKASVLEEQGMPLKPGDPAGRALWRLSMGG